MDESVPGEYVRQQEMEKLAAQSVPGAVECMICFALYVPSQAQPSLQRGSQRERQSAYLSMCHFCFRCRRPACPACWDEINGLCGSCVQEVGLSFREAPPLLSGAVEPSIRQAQTERVSADPPPMTLIREGRFQDAQARTIETPPGGLFRDMRSVLDSMTWESDPGRTGQPPQSGMQALTSPPASVSATPVSPSPRRGGKIVLIFFVVLLIILLIVAVLVTLALLFANVNAALMYLLHVDIRALIAYLLRIIQSIRIK